MNILRKIVGAPNALLRGVAEHLAVRWLRDGLAGKHGPWLQKPLEFLKGKKTAVGFALGIVGFVLVAFGADSAPVMAAGGILVSVGVLDKAINQPGRPEWLQNSGLYKIAADNAGLLTTAITTGYAYVTGVDCASRMIAGYALTCPAQGRILLGVAAVLVYIGILDVGFLSKTPASLKVAAKR